MRPRHCIACSLLPRARRRLPRPHPASATARTATTAIRASVNAWARVYEEDARAAAGRADDATGRGRRAPALRDPDRAQGSLRRGRKALTASSRVLDEVPERDCDIWAGSPPREWCCSGTCTHTSSPRAARPTRSATRGRSSRSAGGSSGGSAAALASGAGSGSHRHGHGGLVPHSLGECGTSTIKPTRGLVSMRGIVPLCPTFDHAGPMARTVVDCEPLLAAMAGVAPPASRRPLAPLSPCRRASPMLDPDVADGFESALDGSAARRVELEPPPAPLDSSARRLPRLFCTEMLVYHRRFDDRRELYRPSNRRLARARGAAGR